MQSLCEGRRFKELAAYRIQRYWRGKEIRDAQPLRAMHSTSTLSSLSPIGRPQGRRLSRSQLSGARNLTAPARTLEAFSPVSSSGKSMDSVQALRLHNNIESLHQEMADLRLEP